METFVFHVQTGPDLVRLRTAECLLQLYLVQEILCEQLQKPLSCPRLKVKGIFRLDFSVWISAADFICFAVDFPAYLDESKMGGILCGNGFYAQNK